MALSFIITVDTEADNQWQVDSSLTVKNLEWIPRFQDLCEKFGFIPTYLLTYEVAVDSIFMGWLKSKVDLGLADFGAHLHPWSNPPWREETERTQKTFPSQLEETLLLEKLVVLTTAIEQNLGYRPKSFRAGRWGISPLIIDQIKNLGYEIDSSTTPPLDWSQLIKSAPVGLNFKSTSLAIHDWQGIIEVPMSVMPVPRWGVRFGPLGNKLFYKKVWGRIFPETQVADLINAFNEAERLGLTHFQFMTHSSELMPLGSIYNKSESDLENFYHKLIEWFKFMSEQDIKPIPLSAIDKKATTISH
jgi:hypothetical protein